MIHSPFDTPIEMAALEAQKVVNRPFALRYRMAYDAHLAGDVLKRCLPLANNRATKHRRDAFDDNSRRTLHRTQIKASARSVHSNNP